MTAKNEITGDTISTKPSSKAYREQWELIYGDAVARLNDPQEPISHADMIKRYEEVPHFLKDQSC